MTCTRPRYPGAPGNDTSRDGAPRARLKLLFVSPYLPSLIRVRPYHFIRELSQRHEITLLATDVERALTDAAGLRELSARFELVPLRLRNAIVSCAVGALKGKPLQAAVCQSAELRRRLHDLVRGSEFDIVHLEHLRAADLRDSLPEHVPTLFDAVDSISLLLERTLSSSHSLRQRLIARLELDRTRRFEAAILPRFDRVIVTAPEDRQMLQTLAPASRISVVPNGVDLDYFQPVLRKRDPATIVFSGKMSYHANVTAAVHFVRDIFPLIRAERPTVRLLIVGSSPARAVRALERDPAIRVTGYVPDIREALAAATVAVCPVTVKVGIQNKILEAMAMGLPVVSSIEGAAGLSARPGRDLLVADTATDFAAKVSQVLADASLGDCLGQAGRNYVETNHHWSAIVRDVERVYQAAVAEKTTPYSGPAGGACHRPSIADS